MRGLHAWLSLDCPFRLLWSNNILTYCYHYDPGTNKHSLIVARVVQLGGLTTLLSLGGFMWVMFRRDLGRDHAPTREAEAPGTKVNDNE